MSQFFNNFPTEAFRFHSRVVSGGIGRTALLRAWGLFNLSHPDLSPKILEHPLTDLDLSEAEVMATSCLASLMQFKLGIQQTGTKVQVKHWAELMV